MADATALAGVLDKLGRARVLVVGDVMLDRFVTGSVERISPEAPIPVLRVEPAKTARMLGGAGNVARNVAALGASVQLAGVIGDDSAADEIAALAKAEPRLSSLLVRQPGRTTTVKTRFLGAGQQMLRVDEEDRRPPATDVAQQVLKHVERALAATDIVVVSDYAKGGSLFAPVLERARAAKVLVVVDPKEKDFRRYDGAAVLTPNVAELGLATGMAVDGDEAIAAAASATLQHADIAALVVTRGAAGMTVVERGRAPVHLRVRERTVFDVSGAGDTVVATLATALALGASLVQAAELANLAAGIVVGKVGTAVATHAEVLEALYAGEMLGADAKVVDAATALDHVQRWRRGGERIAFTNGCFDLVHPGHVSLLNQARAAADRLIVGLNTDASVRRLKGPSRPIQGEAARATVLAGFAAVDLVVPFADDTPLTLIEALRPDVLVKGADYTVATVVGADLVQSWGGKVVLAELAPGASSSSLVSRVTDGERKKRVGSS